jgi:hypothetical protein
MPISRNNSNFLFCPQLSSLFPPLRQVAPPAQKFVDERPLLFCYGIRMSFCGFFGCVNCLYISDRIKLTLALDPAAGTRAKC